MKVWFPAIRAGSGTDVFTQRLADALRRRGFEAEITWLAGKWQLAPFLLQSVRPPKGTSIVHANSWNGFAFARQGIPLVVTEHLNVFDPLYHPHKSLAQSLYHQSLIRRFVRASLSKASAITAVSRSTASSLKDAWPRFTARVIHNWIDTGVFIPPDRKQRSGGAPFELLFVGNLSRRKGADLLAPIMRELGGRFHLRFTTGLRQSRPIPTESNMIPIGRITEESHLVQAYQDCDAVLVPSRLEGFGLTALEAMACGKPVVASRSSSLPEIVEDGVTGILCPIGDVSAFAAACRKLAENPDLRNNYGLAARRRSVELFSEAAIIPQYVALYEEVSG
jgi:glycosyltransferase involved in cell wall biosynthesis